jgi:integrase
MPKRIVAGLSARRVATEKRAGLHGDGGGLYLQVAPTGAKTWIYRYQIAGRRRDMGLGSADVYSLAEAREKARTARRSVADGIDPIEARRQARLSARLADAKAMTFRAAAEAYIEAHLAGWKNPKHAAQWPATLAAYAYPVLGELPVAAVDTGFVMKAVEPIWTEKPETASRVRGRIESVLDWARARGYRDGENPARWKSHLSNLLPARSKVRRVEHYAALPYAELPKFLGELRRRDSTAALALEFAILTAARTGEVLGATWAEIDLANHLWVIPAARMKAGREHRVPLSASAMKILERLAMAKTGEHVFPGAKPGGPLSQMAMLMLLRRMERPDPGSGPGQALTAHGFRSTFSDWAAEQTNTPSEVREMALAHTVGDKVEAAYRRGDLFAKRRELAEAWGRFCQGGGAAKIVPLRREA